MENKLLQSFLIFSLSLMTLWSCNIINNTKFVQSNQPKDIVKKEQLEIIKKIILPSTKQVIPIEESFQKIFKLSDRNLWLVSDYSVFQSIDSGESWYRCNLNLPKSSEITDIFFLNDRQGWITACDQADNSYILSSNDSGRNWETSHKFKSTQLLGLRFFSGMNGVAFGRKYSKKEGKIQITIDKPFLIRSKDYGKSWDDLSMQVNELINKSEPDTYDFFEKITDDSNCIRLISSLGKEITIENTVPIRIAQLPFQNPHKLGCHEGKLWAVGGQDSIEGYHGYIAFEKNDQYDIGYKVGASFNDAVLLSDNRMLLCGSVVNGNDLSQFNENRSGAVFIFNQASHELSLIYTDSEAPSFNAIKVIDDTRILLAGNTSNLVWLPLPAHDK